MHRAFAAFQLIRVAFLQCETRATVLQQDAELVRGDARAEAVEDRIDERDRHAVAVDHGDIDRVFMHRLADRGGGGHGAFGVDQGRKGAGGFGGEHMLQPRGVVRVGQKAVARVIGQFGGLSFDMQALGPQWVHPGDVEVIEDIHQQQGCRPLAIGRMFDHFEVFVLA